MTALESEWLSPPPGGWTLADVQALPEKCRVEVIDGALIVNPSPLPIHQRVVRRLAAQLEPQLPPSWQLEYGVDVMLSEDPLDYLTPDIVVFSADVPLTTRPIPGKQILLVVEVVSRGSRREDRGAKPLAYAEGGIQHFWRVESPASGALAIELHAFASDRPGAEYTPAGLYRERLTIGAPFPIDIDLTSLTG
ncbi:MAG TPA: Uma2 family endonuclease [Streptosporangiaceae bacterium]|jgi:Uma2 family endonuclease